MGVPNPLKSMFNHPNVFYKRWDFWLFSLLLAALLMRIYHLYLPGPYADEVNWVELALRMKLKDFNAVDDQMGFSWANRWWVTVMAPHTLGFPIYPIFASLYLTDSILSNRVINLLYGLAILAFTFGFTKDAFGKKAAFFALLMLVFMPTSVRYSRIDVIYIRSALAIALYFFIYRWYLTRNGLYFAGFMLALGIGLSTRPEILWVIGAWVGYVLIANLRLIRGLWHLLRDQWRKALLALIPFALGGAWFILYNIQSQGGSFRYYLSLAPQRSVVNNNLIESIGRNIWLRWVNLTELLNGNVPFIGVRADRVPVNDLYVWVFCCAFLGLAGYAIWKRMVKSPDRRTEFLLITALLLFVESLITSSVFSAVHLLYLYPLLPIIIAVFLSKLTAISLPRIPIKLLRAVPLLLLALLLTFDLAADVQYYQILDATGGYGTQSSAVYELVAQLEKNNQRDVYAGDWGISTIIYVVSHGRIDPTSIFGWGVWNPQAFYAWIDGNLNNPNAVYVFYPAEIGTYKRLGPFIRYVKEKQYRYEESIISDGYGGLFYIYTNVRPATR